MDSGGRPAAPPRPSFCFIFLQHCQHPTGKWTSSDWGGFTLDARNQSSLGFNFKCTPKTRRKKNENKGRRTRGIKLLKKGRRTVCIWWSVQSFAVVSRFVDVLLLLFVNISVEKQWPLLQPHPSATLLNWHTRKHLGLLLCTGPPLLLLYNFSADACTIYTVYNITETGQNGIKTQLNVTKATVTFCSSCTSTIWTVHLSLLCFIIFVSN